MLEIIADTLQQIARITFYSAFIAAVVVALGVFMVKRF